MQLKSVLKLSVMLTLILLLAVGCAKKPTGDESSKVTQTQMQQQKAAGVSEQAVSEQGGSTSASASASTGQSTMTKTVASLMRVNFEYDQYVLTAAARATLKNNAIYLNAKGVRVQVEGHCDERGSDEYNLALGEKRALAVKNYLVSLGVPAGRLSIISYGEEIPLVMANNEKAWSQNRRAEFKELY